MTVFVECECGHGALFHGKGGCIECREFGYPEPEHPYTVTEVRVPVLCGCEDPGCEGCADDARYAA